ncbi:Protein of unknown function [Caldanaerobius fijiensis DSM 17918]|uniref:DUF3232 domain-containing protein n=1 Tax=Caldanaerobius fijiensis DSM 17918 TaxID=1121256 RepID=A0A1M5FJU7_9THEO|nr:DUF3232 domain-containing protein [Caldanaerobius fijiensis]SHF91431.1 Protein of unknown function [Caldanaerobius fijiensis DSM 17918]
MIREKFNSLVEKIKSSGSSFVTDDMLAIEEYIKACGNYVKAVIDMEAAMIAARDRMEPREYREYIAQLDKNRKVVHDSLIASTKLINRLCETYGEPIIYTGGDNRIEIAEFAKKVIDEIFMTRTL